MLRSWILVVDDDEGFRDCMTEILQVEGFEVETAVDGEAGLEVLRKAADTRPCLIFLDARMPKMGGRAFLEAFDQQMPSLSGEVPVILCTASQREAAAFRVDRRRHVLEKPSSVVEILDRTYEWMRPPEMNPA